MSQTAHVRLSGMMFLQYAVWGIWLPILARYLQASPAEGGLGFTAGHVGWILGLAGSVGALSAPFIAGQLADRYFSAERFLSGALPGQRPPDHWRPIPFGEEFRMMDEF